jgi:hypothetical protein
MPDQTLRYRAQTRLPYALALRDLAEYAHFHPDPDFTFGPMTLERMESEGLVISGPGLEGVKALLSSVPGLVESDS